MQARRSGRRGSRSASARRSPWTGSSSRSSGARCTATWARTGPGRRRRSGSCSGCSVRATAGRSSSGSTPGATRSPPTAASPTWLQSRSFGQGSPPSRRSSSSPACAAARTPPIGTSCVERFQLDRDKKVRALSHGNRQKVQLIAAFASRAELLILDEPTGGLDPLMEMAFRETVGEAKERGQTVFLSSHILSEVEAVCDRVGILRAGKLVDEGTLAELRHLSAQTVEVTFDGRVPELPQLPGIEVSQAGANALRFEVSGSVGPLIAALADQPVADLSKPRALARGDLPAPLRERGREWRALARSPGARSPTPASARSPLPCSSSSPPLRRRPPTGRATRRSPSGSGSRAPSAGTTPRACSTARLTTCSRYGRLRQLARGRDDGGARGALRTARRGPRHAR